MLGEQTRFIITGSDDRVLVSVSGTLQLAKINNDTEVKIYKDYGSALRATYRFKNVVEGSLRVQPVKISYRL